MNRDQAIRNAALLVSSLDRELAETLLAELPSELADAVRDAADGLDAVAGEERDAVIAAFLDSQCPPRGDDFVSYSREAAHPTAEGAGPVRVDPPSPMPHAATPHFHDEQRAAPHRRGAPFQSLQAIDADLLSSLLESEPPQVISLVIANLAAHKAGDVLARHPADVQTEVIHRLARLQRASDEVLEEIDRYLTAQLTELQVEPAPEPRDDAGMATVSAILNSADESARRQILSNLALRDRPLAGKLRRPARSAMRPQFTFEEVCRLDTASLVKVVQAAPWETAVLAFAGADGDLVASLIDNLPEEASQRLDRGIAELGPTRLADIEGAQAAIVDVAGKLAAEGQLRGGQPVHLTAVA